VRILFLKSESVIEHAMRSLTFLLGSDAASRQRHAARDKGVKKRGASQERLGVSRGLGFSLKGIAEISGTLEEKEDAGCHEP
jgi:hypothetical protein